MAIVRIRATAPWKSLDAVSTSFESGRGFGGATDYRISAEEQCNIEKCLSCCFPKCINCLDGGKQGRRGRPELMGTEPEPASKRGRGRPRREVKA